MEISEPKKGEFTVYSKSGCVNCFKVKKLLKDKSLLFSVVDCDEYLLEDKEVFLQFIQKHSGKQHNSFPMVFDGLNFVGGFTETNKYVELLLSFDMTF
jgi:hypothetical protein